MKTRALLEEVNLALREAIGIPDDAARVEDIKRKITTHLGGVLADEVQFRFDSSPGPSKDSCHFIELENLRGQGVGSDHGWGWFQDGDYWLLKKC